MSVFGLERSQTSPAAAYDHSINLIDSTKPEFGQADTGSPSSASLAASNIDKDSGSQLDRQWTRPHLRKELARRKYAKWQEDEGGSDVATQSLDKDRGDGDPDISPSPAKPAKHGKIGTVEQLRDKGPFQSKSMKKAKKKKYNEDISSDATFIDVLYENQRGSFLCGIPLYSANSLLNFDPSGWQNATFKDSAVDITNAQLPDPSWIWAWRNWYVDMSHDVDEEGWEYSFSFSRNFAWHGNHPWFHSFCRRRRWLRKRVKAHGHFNEMREGRGVKEAHKLAADYFSIHAASRERSRSTSGDRNTTGRSSFMAGIPVDGDDDEPIEISDVATLMTVVRHARVDREINAAVAKLLDQGGDELFYLADNIPTIMEGFVHHASRRQLQKMLFQALDATTKTEISGADDATDKEDARKRRSENILKAVDAAGVHADDQDYWTDLRARAIGKKQDSSEKPQNTEAITSEDVETERDVKGNGGDDVGVGDEIKGISKDAEISIEPGIRRPYTEREDEIQEKKPSDKGKEVEKA